MGIQGFLRPIEITADTDNYRVRTGGGAWNNLALTIGVRGNVLTICEEIRSSVIALGGNFVNFKIGFYSSNRICFGYNGGASTYGIDFTDTNLARILGYPDTTADAAEVEADYTPRYCWFPTYQSTNQERLAIKQSDAFSGSMAKDGTLAGTSTGPDVYERPFNFEHIDAPLTFESATTDAYETYRCFERLIKESRTSMSSVAGAPASRGFYYVPDLRVYRFATDDVTADAQPTLTDVGTTWDSGGIEFDLTATPDQYVFGFSGEAGAKTPTASVQRARQYYECAFDFHTAPAPTWDD